jgi:DNA-directed RNA polymerase subunit M/transcription elongation factor TFIIS
LYSGQVDFGFYKLICTICNGVQYVDNLVGISYEIYNSCGGNHLLTNGNMIAVASYGNSDYYKCKYCRYVAPFSFNVTQNYVKTYYSPSVHKQSNAVEGLEYTVSYEEHTLENHTCIECGSHVEMYDNIYTNISDTQHEVSCSCGEIISIRDHSANRYSYVNSLEHGVYCVCGLLLSYEPHRKVSSGLKTYCRDCGHIFSGSGFTPGIMSGNDGFVNE